MVSFAAQYTVTDFVLVSYGAYVLIAILGLAWVAKIFTLEDDDRDVLVKRWPIALLICSIFAFALYFVYLLPIRIGTMFFIDGMLCMSIFHFSVSTIARITGVMQYVRQLRN